jgi:hypothetical protein
MNQELAHRAPRMAMGALQDPETLGRVLAASGYFDDAKEAAQAVVKVLAGMELGFGPIASMTGIFIVKGRVTLGANLMAASIKRHPRYDYRIRDLSGELAAVTFYEGGAEVGTSEFSMEDARRAGLAGGETWKKYPRNMLLWRALSNGAKFFCPDVFAGAPVYTPDELGADVDPETGEIIDAPPAAIAAAATTTGGASPRPPEPATSESSPSARSAGPASGVDPTPEPSAPGGADASASGADKASTAVRDTSTAAPLSAPPGEHASDPVSPQEIESLRQVLDGLGAPETFARMALMSLGKSELAELTRGEAFDMLARANARFGG